MLFQKEIVSDHELRPFRDKAAIIQCELIQTTLTHVQEDITKHYTELSYVWVDATETTSVLFSRSTTTIPTRQMLTTPVDVYSLL